MIKKFKGAKIAYVIFALVIFGLICNIIYIGATGKHLVSGSEIEEFAKTRGKKEEILVAKRGQIISSDGEIISANVKKYKLRAVVDKTRINNNSKKLAYVADVQATAQQVAPILQMDVTEMENKLQQAIDAGKFQVEFGVYGSNLSSLDVEKIQALNLPGLEFDEHTSRNYPMNNFASYTIGYAQGMEEAPEKIVGKMGLEKLYDKELSGKDGHKVSQTNVDGTILPNGVLEEKKAVNGEDVHLTIDASLQRNLDVQLEKSAQEAGAKRAVCAIMEAKTGRILAISSWPGFDPNQRNITDYNNMFFDQLYECGSVFKPFVYANVIEDGKFNQDETFVSGSYNVTYNGKSVATVKDWNRGGGWGTISYKEGLARSSNVAIANLMDKYVNKESIVEDYHKLGFFEDSKVDRFDTPAGTEIYKVNPQRLEYITTGYGQGSTVTAFQLLRAYSVFANNGKTVEPYLVDRVVNPDTKEVSYTGNTKYSEQIFSPETITQMNELLYNNIYGKGAVGSNYTPDDPNIKILGKTGTGQIADPETGGYRTDIYSKSFAGLAPYDDPEIILYTMFQCPDSQTGPIIADFAKTMIPAALASNSSYTTSAQTVEDNTYEMDNFMNQSVNFAKAKLEAKGFQVEVIGSGTSIIDQFPSATTIINKGDRVFLRGDGGEITVPDMSGWSRKEVSTYASLSGIDIQITGETGRVVDQTLPPGTLLNSGEIFNVTLQ